jgi:hypothetical protein
VTLSRLFFRRTRITNCTDEKLLGELKGSIHTGLSTYSGELQGTLLGLEQRTIANYKNGKNESQANVPAIFDEFHGYRMVQTCTISGSRIISIVDGKPSDGICKEGACKTKTSMAPQFTAKAGEPRWQNCIVNGCLQQY